MGHSTKQAGSTQLTTRYSRLLVLGQQRAKQRVEVSGQRAIQHLGVQNAQQLTQHYVTGSHLLHNNGVLGIMLWSFLVQSHLQRGRGGYGA